jgi:PKD repeat protein
MTYNTASTPNETRQGYFILTATNTTYPTVGMTKGYSIFYEGGNSSAATAETTTSSGSLALRPLAAPVREVFDSFELVAVVVPTEQPLTVQIISSGTIIEGVAPATYEFEANVIGGTEPYTYSWDFGDGSEESNEETVEHTFEEAGTYNMSLTVIDSGGQSASDSIEITVEDEEEEEEEPPAEEEVEEEPIPLLPPPPPVEEEEEEEEEPIPSPPPADDGAETIEDEVDAFVQELLDRFGVENPGLP